MMCVILNSDLCDIQSIFFTCSSKVLFHVVVGTELVRKTWQNVTTVVGNLTQIWRVFFFC
jgi:hypothetical protein